MDKHAICKGVAALAFTGAVAGCTASPTLVYGDSLVVQVGTVPGAEVHASNGTNACDWEQQIRQDTARHPVRVLLVFTGNPWSAPSLQAWQTYGPGGVGVVQAECMRVIRRILPASTQLVVMSTLACRTAWPNGSPLINKQWQQMALTSPNTQWRTYTDDSLTPGHVFVVRDSRGVLRAPDGVHLVAPAGYDAYRDAISRAVGG